MTEQLDLFKELEKRDGIIRQQQVCGGSALRLLKVIDGEGLIAGGAPRDWLFDRPAKDLDIYIRGIEGEGNLEFAERVSAALESPVQNVTSNSDYLNALDNGVVGVFNVTECYLPIQVIRCDRHPLDMLATFHCSLSRAYAKRGKDGLIIAGNWEFNVSRKYNMNMIIKNYDPKYISRIRAKFPGFTEVFEQ